MGLGLGLGLGLGVGLGLRVGWAVTLRKICRRCSTRGPKCSSVGAMRARASMSSRTTSSEALLRQVKSAGQIC